MEAFIREQGTLGAGPFERMSGPLAVEQCLGYHLVTILRDPIERYLSALQVIWKHQPKILGTTFFPESKGSYEGLLRDVLAEIRASGRAWRIDEGDVHFKKQVDLLPWMPSDALMLSEAHLFPQLLERHGVSVVHGQPSERWERPVDETYPTLNVSDDFALLHRQLVTVADMTTIADSYADDYRLIEDVLGPEAWERR
jgi:hypothetical protein